MAKFEVNEFAGFYLSMQDLATLPDNVEQEMLQAEASVVVDAQKKQARTMGVVDSGQLAASITSTKPRRGKSNGDLMCFVYPQGSRTRNGIKTRNGEIAFINEFGKKGQVARPFIKTANEKSADSAVDAAAKIYNNYVDKLNL